MKAHIDRSSNERAVARRLLAAFSLGDDEATSAALQAQLTERAAREGLLDVAYRTVDSPFGSLLLAASRAGLVRVGFEREGHEAVLERLASEISPRILCAPQRLDAAARQLDEYFARRRKRFELPLDLQLARGFRRAVLVRLQRIAYGETTSYAQLARAAGKPAAVRAAGSACSHNPLPVVVPCHRVVRSDGTFGEYLGGPEMKRALLEMERAA
jgi:methylated-DNA-[protein]-cysteine S-methyltransferase